MNDDSVDAFCAKVERSCEVRCPGCDTNRSQLPKSARNVPKLKLLPSQAVHIPRLRDLCFEFCLHRVAAADVVVFAQSTFGADIGLSIVETMLPLFHDPERRASMYLRLRRQNPFIYTMCCKAPVCFFCHVAGHHNGIACGGVSPDLLDSIVECEDCGLQLVKGDGCDSVQCYCGVNFQWSVEVLKTPMRSMMRSLQPFRRKLRYHISRWVQRLRKNRALEEIKCRYLRIEAKEFWKLYRETHPDEVQDVDDELSLMMSMDFEGC
ncbi:hypothetical protein DYB32_010234 [Aphanomyces invadans]|nr:hypothetical protein DYB32_010234 [Aphanomyces invadans]